MLIILLFSPIFTRSRLFLLNCLTLHDYMLTYLLSIKNTAHFHFLTLCLVFWSVHAITYNYVIYSLCDSSLLVIKLSDNPIDYTDTSGKGSTRID